MQHVTVADAGVVAQQQIDKCCGIVGGYGWSIMAG